MNDVTWPTIQFRRISGVIALPMAFLCQLICNSIYARISTSSGLADTESAAATAELGVMFPGEGITLTMFVPPPSL